MLTNYVVFSINYFNLLHAFSQHPTLSSWSDQIKQILTLHKIFFIATHKHDKSVAVLSFRHMFSPVQSTGNLTARLSLYEVINDPGPHTNHASVWLLKRCWFHSQPVARMSMEKSNFLALSKRFTGEKQEEKSFFGVHPSQFSQKKLDRKSTFIVRKEWLCYFLRCQR